MAYADFLAWLNQYYSNELDQDDRIYIAQRAEEFFRPSFSQRVSKGSPEEGEFAGRTFVPNRDEARLRGQEMAVFKVLQDGEWHTLNELAEKCGGSTQAISARIRDLRKPEFGGFDVKAENFGGGLWKYRLIALPSQP